jgi:hypothetical protein
MGSIVHELEMSPLLPTTNNCLLSRSFAFVTLRRLLLLLLTPQQLLMLAYLLELTLN